MDKYSFIKLWDTYNHGKTQALLGNYDGVCESVEQLNTYAYVPHNLLQRPTLFLDVDGVVNCLDGDYRNNFSDNSNLLGRDFVLLDPYATSKTGEAYIERVTIVVHKDVKQWLLWVSEHVNIIWVTSWNFHAPLFLDPYLNIISQGILPISSLHFSEQAIARKAHLISHFVRDNNIINPLWIDDNIDARIIDIVTEITERTPDVDFYYRKTNPDMGLFIDDIVTWMKKVKIYKQWLAYKNSLNN